MGDFTDSSRWCNVEEFFRNISKLLFTLIFNLYSSISEMLEKRSPKQVGAAVACLYIFKTNMSQNKTVIWQLHLVWYLKINSSGQSEVLVIYLAML